MKPRVINKAWSDIQVNDRIRFATPRFVKYGVVVKRDGTSIVLDLNEGKLTVLPNGRWYFVEGKRDPDGPEHLVVLENFPADSKNIHHDKLDAADEFMLVFQVAELLNMDEKKVRRYIRKGVIQAFKNKDERWVVRRSWLLDKAGKHGWI